MQLRLPFFIKNIFEALNNQTKSLEQMIRPYVIVDIYPKRSINMLYFRIRNVGQSPAYKISIIPETDIPFRKRHSSDLPIFQNPISAIGPGEELSFFYESAIELFSKEDPVLEFSVCAEYCDTSKKKYHDDFFINLGIFKGLSLDMPASDRLVSELERIQRELEKLSRSVDRIVQNELSKDLEEVPNKYSPVKEDSSE